MSQTADSILYGQISRLKPKAAAQPDYNNIFWADVNLSLNKDSLYLNTFYRASSRFSNHYWFGCEQWAVQTRTHFTPKAWTDRAKAVAPESTFTYPWTRIPAQQRSKLSRAHSFRTEADYLEQVDENLTQLSFPGETESPVLIKTEFLQATYFLLDLPLKEYTFWVYKADKLLFIDDHLSELFAIIRLQPRTD